MNPISFVPHSPLTQNDIARLPQSTTNASVVPSSQDAFVYTEEKKKFGWKGILLTVAALAAATVALKRFGQNSFMKIADPQNMKIMDKVKNAINKTADCIEFPFVKGFKYLKGLFGGKTAEKAAEQAAEAVS